MSEIALSVMAPGWISQKDLVARENITVKLFYVSFDERNYMKEGVDIGVRDLSKMVDNKGVFPKSSLPSAGLYGSFEPIIAEGKGTVCICITSKFSGSVQSATNAKYSSKHIQMPNQSD